MFPPIRLFRSWHVLFFLNSQKNYGNYGNQAETVFCRCDEGFFGNTCNLACSDSVRCSSHGTCVFRPENETVECMCGVGWTGEECSIPVVPGPPGPSPLGPTEPLDWISSLYSVSSLCVNGFLVVVVVVLVVLLIRKDRHQGYRVVKELN